MSWSWCHTAEAVEYARRQVDDLPRSVLIEIMAEWRMYQLGRPDDMWPNEWPKALAFMRRKFAGRHRWYVAAHVWELALEQATCENGGFVAHTCPYGCLTHSVSFSPVEELVA